MGTNVTTAFITCPQNESETLGIKLPFLVMIIKNVNMSSRSSRSISPSKFKYSTIRMYAGGSELPTISPPLEWSHLYVLCLCDWTRAGIRSSSTSQISRAEPMEATISRHYESPFTLIAESEEYIFLIASTPKRSSLPSSSYSCPSKSSNDVLSILYNQKSKNNAGESVNHEDRSHFTRLLRSSLARFTARCARAHTAFACSIRQDRASQRIIQLFIRGGSSLLSRELFCPFFSQDSHLTAELDFILAQWPIFLSRFGISYLSWNLFLLFTRIFSFHPYLPFLFSFYKETLKPVWCDNSWYQLEPEAEQVLAQRYITSVTYQHFACLSEGILSCFGDLCDIHRAKVISYDPIQAGRTMPAN